MARAGTNDLWHSSEKREEDWATVPEQREEFSGCVVLRRRICCCGGALCKDTQNKQTRNMADRNIFPDSSSTKIKVDFKTQSKLLYQHWEWWEKSLKLWVCVWGWVGSVWLLYFNNNSSGHYTRSVSHLKTTLLEDLLTTQSCMDFQLRNVTSTFHIYGDS